jgi:D-lactate dehydrogenase
MNSRVSKVHTPSESTRSIDRLAKAHDASHYSLVPEGVTTPSNAQEIASLFEPHREPSRSAPEGPV